jgi:hypothetical protein
VPDKEENRITIKVDPELFKNLGYLRLSSGIDFQTAGEVLFRAWSVGELRLIKSGQGYSAVPHGHQCKYPYAEDARELHEKLETILSSGDTKTTQAVVPNIEVFYERLRPVSKKAAASGKRGGKS